MVLERHFIVEGGLPELGLTLQIVHPQHDRPDPDHVDNVISCEVGSNLAPSLLELSDPQGARSGFLDHQNPDQVARCTGGGVAGA